VKSKESKELRVKKKSKYSLLTAAQLEARYSVPRYSVRLGIPALCLDIPKEPTHSVLRR
jgi:hypothetical protein